MESIVVMSLFSVFCIGRHHAIIGLHRGCQLRRLYVHVLWRHLARQRLANALGCAASLPKLRSCCTVNQSVCGHSKGKSPLLTFVHICTGSVCVCLSCRKLLHLCMCINAGGIGFPWVLSHLIIGWRISKWARKPSPISGTNYSPELCADTQDFA